MGKYIDKLYVAFAGEDDATANLRPGTATLPFDVNDVVGSVKLLRDTDLLAIDKAVDQEIAGRGLPDPDKD